MENLQGFRDAILPEDGGQSCQTRENQCVVLQHLFKTQVVRSGMQCDFGGFRRTHRMHMFRPVGLRRPSGRTGKYGLGVQTD